MQSVFEDFETRVEEVDGFIRLLRFLEMPGACIVYETNTKNRVKQVKRMEPGWTKTLKASAFLLLYNIVESALRRGIGVVYERIRVDQRSFDQLIDELGDVWIEQGFKRIDPGSASPLRYRQEARSLIRRVAKQEKIHFDDRRLPVSGNLDAEQVRKVCRLHNIPLDVHYRALGGAELITVKTQRNDLAHGSISFSECGRQYTVDELERIKRQVVVFMRSILRSIGAYIRKQSYAA